jgi:hypothetical protein
LPGTKGFIETFAIEDIEVSPIGCVNVVQNIAKDFEDEYKHLFYH